jgi:hypothetical protein
VIIWMWLLLVGTAVLAVLMVRDVAKDVMDR